MILELHVQNYALIDQLSLNFAPGLNILTGETGSGKSIVLGALSLVLGEKASADLVRTGEEQAYVELILDLDGYNDLQEYLQEMGFEDEEDCLILSRRIQKGGKSFCRINGKTVPLSIMKEVGRFIIDIYGQHEHVSLFKPDKQLSLLDRFGGMELLNCQKEFARGYAQYKSLEKKYREMLAKEEEKNYKEELLSFQVGELEKASLIIGEDEELAQEEKVLSNGEKIQELLNRSYSALYQNDQLNNSILDGLYQVAGAMQELSKYDTSYNQWGEKILSVRYELEEIARELAVRKDELQWDPKRLEEVQNRLVFLSGLKKKYQKDIPELIAYLSSIREELNFFADYQEELDRIKIGLDKLEQEVYSKAFLLSEIRKKAAQILEKMVKQELEDLGMKNIDFCLSFTSEKTNLSSNGLDKVEFLFSSNKGEKKRPLSAIASGGELSRVMLALKVILAKVDQIPTLLFDEIDAGIGGRTAQVVAEKLSLVSEERQIICVTHSPQIASMADQHFFISKDVLEERTKTLVKSLEVGERVEEISRMLSGAKTTSLTKEHAKEMLEMAKKFKENRIEEIGKTTT